MLDFLMSLMSKAEKGVEEKPTTAEGWALKGAMQLINHYIHGKDEFAETLHNVVECLMNPDDPVVKDLSFTDRMTMQGSLMMFRRARKAAHGKEESEAG